MDFSKSLLDNFLKREKKKEELEQEYNQYLENLGMD